MTDNEIIKALECCEVSGTCEYCPLKSDKKNCLSLLSKNALDLINRQKANAEGLINAVKFLNEKLSYAKAEVVKEFAERLKETANSRMYRKDVVYIVEIDNLVKEMVGAESG